MRVDLIEGATAKLLCTASAQKKGAYAGVRQNVSADILDMIIVTSNSHQNCLKILVTQA